jgi:hypothetical protein
MRGDRVPGVTRAQGSELLKLFLCVGQVKELAVLVARMVFDRSFGFEIVRSW